MILTEQHTEAEESFQRLVPINFSNYEAQNFIVSSFEKLSTRFGAGCFVSRQNIKNPYIEEAEEYDLSFLDKLPRLVNFSHMYSVRLRSELLVKYQFF